MRIEERNDRDLDYLERVNRAIDHVVSNLDQPLRLEDVARVAYFSPFHFHRIFQTMVGETLAQFVKRLRLERALYVLSHDPRRSLTEVAHACGFASSSDFSRSFRQRYGVPPSAFDVEKFRDGRRDEWTAMLESAEPGRYQLDRLPAGENPDGFTVELRDLPPRVVAYIRVAKPFRPGAVDGASERLVAWAEARGLADGQWLGYMWDDPEIVAHDDCRYDVGLEVPDVTPDGEVGRFEFPAMTVAQIEVRGPIDLEQRAIDYMFRTWMPTEGYVPTDQPNFEAWIGRPFAHGFEHFEILAQFPVVRA